MGRSGVLENPVLELDQNEEKHAEGHVGHDRLLEGERLVKPETRDAVHHLDVNPIHKERGHAEIAEWRPASKESIPQRKQWVSP